MKAKIIVVAMLATLASTSKLTAQTKTSQLILSGPNGMIKINPPSAPGSGITVFEFPTAPTGAKFVLTESNSGQTINSDLTITGDLSLTFGGASAHAGDVLTRNADGTSSWQAPSGGGGSGGVPTTRSITTTSPLTIDNGSSADLSADRAIALSYNSSLGLSGGELGLNLSSTNSWLASQSFPSGDDATGHAQGNALMSSMNVATTQLAPARRIVATTESITVAANYTMSSAVNTSDVIGLANSSGNARIIALPNGTTAGHLITIYKLSGHNTTLADNTQHHLKADWVTNTPDDTITLMWTGSYWLEMYRADY